MKKILFSMALLFGASITYAQQNVIKEVKSIINSTNPDFAKAEQLIKGALANAETSTNPETWNIAGQLQKKRSEKEMEKAYLKKAYDTLQVYNSALDMCKYFIKCDELAQQPDAKGKIKNKYRKANASAVLGERGNLINGGINFYNNAKDDEGLLKKALEYFAMYVDVSASPLMSETGVLQSDTILPQIAYYAGLTSMKLKDWDSVLKYSPYAENDKEVGQYAMEFVSSALKEKGDTVKWMASLQKGLEKYPNDQFFFGNMIDYYSNNNKYDEAHQYVDAQLEKDPNNSFYQYVKGYLYHNQKEYDKALTYYKKAVELKSDYAEAYSNMGLIYCLQAQDFSEKATTDVNDPTYAKDQNTLKEFYLKARPMYEKARQLKPDQKDLWLQGLYRVYYNLHLGDEYTEIEKLMN